MKPQTRDDTTLQKWTTPPLQILNKIKFADSPIPVDLKQQITTGQLRMKESQDAFIGSITHIKSMNKQLFRENWLLIMKQRKVESAKDDDAKSQAQDTVNQILTWKSQLESSLKVMKDRQETIWNEYLEQLHQLRMLKKQAVMILTDKLQSGDLVW